ncbi:hypothetical protein [Alteromonas sp. C1M14]|uniref:hypothetical protein n=1 Tax=Alteromonas sp. C1M14 TaxID=2841567 RepID=UPI001C0919A5|nr:hypothetical protein [Alteromonas sp. C1M14]MBU2979202.1 hypothetical protein [Alteromonas sp. C1M14]
MIFLFLFILGITTVLAAGAILIHKKDMHTWIVGFCRRKKPVLNDVSGPVHVMFCFVDHYEPQWKNKDNIELERQRVDRWMQDYPKMASQFTDADGCHPKHSFFFPEEEYRHEHLAKLSDLCARDFGEIEIHLHHENDTSDNLRRTLSTFAQTLHQEHGALAIDPKTNQPVYAFIHGNWALDNSHPQGHWCGVNDELIVLRETGCYADFTFPSPDATQPSMPNTLYYAKDDPNKPKSYDKGIEMKVGGSPYGDMLILQGPLGFNKELSKFGVLPKIERADIRATCPPTAGRVDNWVNTHIHVAGRPEWIFIKIHTHGAQDIDMDCLLGTPVEQMHQHLTTKYNDGEQYKLHYVSAREMYNITKAAEAGMQGDPNEYRDYILPKPTFKRM